jgi:hypothetical protein
MAFLASFGSGVGVLLRHSEEPLTLGGFIVIYWWSDVVQYVDLWDGEASVFDPGTWKGETKLKS